MASCRMVGYIGTDRERLACALHGLRETLVTAQGKGYGVAHYTDEAVLQNRRPGVENAGLPYADLCGGIQTRVLLAHAYSTEQHKVMARDLHPFKFGQWAMAMTGTLPEGEGVHDAMRNALLEEIPDFIRRDVQGYTCSEALFHRFLWRLHEAGQLASCREPLAVAEALRGTLTETQSIAREQGLELNFGPNVLTTNGHRMFALRLGAPMVYSQRTGIADCELCYDGGEIEVPFSVRESHQRYRGIFVASDAEGFGEGWDELEQGAMLVIDSSMELSVL